MLAPWVINLFVFEHDQGAANALAGFMGLDHVIDKAARTSHKRIGEARFVFSFFGGNFCGIALVFAEDDLHRAFGAHHRNLGIGPGEVDVATQMFGSHHVIGTAIGFAGDHRDFRHRAFGIGIEQLGAVLDDAAVFLAGTGHETRHVHKGDHRHIEGITKTHKACGLDRALDV